MIPDSGIAGSGSPDSGNLGYPAQSSKLQERGARNAGPPTGADAIENVGTYDAGARDVEDLRAGDRGFASRMSSMKNDVSRGAGAAGW